MFRLVALWLVFATSISAIGQRDQKSVLIYSKEPGFLSLYIEATLSELKNIDTGNKYFKEVNLLNTIVEDNKLQTQLSRIIWKQNNADNFVTPITKEEKLKYEGEIIKILTNYDYFLTIKTNTLGELIEFQFQLFKPIPTEYNNDEKKDVPKNLIDKALATEDFFINPKDKNYLRDIKNALHRLFENTNSKPQAELRMFDEAIESGAEISIPLNANILFDGSQSGDYDTEEIQYIWRNIAKDKEKKQTSRKIAFEDNQAKQEVIVGDFGKYEIGFKVFDGVQFSDEIIFTINTLQEQRIMVRDSIIESVNYKGIFRNSSVKKEYEGEIQFARIAHKGFEDKFIVANRKIGRKYIEDKHSYLVDTIAKLVKVENSVYDKISFKTLFRVPDIYDERTLYLYLMGPYNYLSDEIEVKHRLKQREIVNIYTKVSLNNLLPIAVAEDGSEDNQAIVYPSIAVGLYLTKNLEVEISGPLIKSREIVYEGKRFFYPASLKPSIKYHFFINEFGKKGLNNLYAKLENSLYKIPEENSEPLGLSSLGFSVGGQYNILSKPYLQMDLILEFGASKFLNEEKLSKTFDANESIGLILRL